MTTVTVFSNAQSDTVSTVASGSLPSGTRMSVVVSVASVHTTNDAAIFIPEFALDVQEVLSSGEAVDVCSSIIKFNWPTIFDINSGSSLRFTLRGVQNGGVDVYVETP